MTGLELRSETRSRFATVEAICRPSNNYVVRMALDNATRQDAFRLRYESYLSQGHIAQNPTRMFMDAYDDIGNSRTVVVYDHRGPVGSVRLCLLDSTDAASPARESFPAELEGLLDGVGVGRGQVAAEITRLVRSPVADDAGLIFLLYRLANYVGHCERVSLLLASVRRNHAVFYRRLGFTTETEPRPYPGLTCLMQLLSCQRAAYERSFEHFPLIAPFASGLTPLSGLLSGESIEVRAPPQRYAVKPAQ